MEKVRCHDCMRFGPKTIRCTKLNAHTFEYRERKCNFYKPKNTDNNEQKEN